jgi:polyphosphate kinase 2 (PPK2 family)
VLITRVHPEILRTEDVPDAKQHGQGIWHHRYLSILDLERHLGRNGTRIVKFYLHLSKEEHRNRFLERIDQPEKNWKFSEADIKDAASGINTWRPTRHASAPPAPARRPGTWCPRTTRRTPG